MLIKLLIGKDIMKWLSVLLNYYSDKALELIVWRVLFAEVDCE